MSCDCSIKLVLIKSDPEFVYDVCKNTPARLQIVRSGGTSSGAIVVTLAAMSEENFTPCPELQIFQAEN